MFIQHSEPIAVAVVALCFINDSNNAEMLWSYAISAASEPNSAAATLTATRLLQFCITSCHLRNDIKANFTYLRLMHQLGHYDEFHAQVACQLLLLLLNVGVSWA